MNPWEQIVKAVTNLKYLHIQDALLSAVDILLVTFVLYRLLILVRGTRFWRILMAVIFYFLVMQVSGKIGLITLNWMMVMAATYLGPLAIVVVFLPEIRQAIEGLGKLNTWTEVLVADEKPKSEARTIEDIVAATSEMSANRVGALIVVEREGNLDEFVNNGILLNARISTPLLVSIFFDQNPLHDGAVIIRRDKIVAAACQLPLAEARRLDNTLHMRHRAAVGISEIRDSIVIVISEERGTIRVAADGKLEKLNSLNELRDLLNKTLRKERKNEPSERPRRLRERRHEVRAP